MTPRANQQVDMHAGQTAKPATPAVGKPWVVFFGEDWGRLGSTGQYLAAELVQTHRVLWVNSLGLRAPRLALSDARRVLRKLSGFIIALLQRDGAEGGNRPEGLVVLNPMALPWLTSTAVRRFNRWLMTRLLHRARSRYGIVEPAIISACPATADIMDVLDPVLTIYYCADEYAAHPGMNPGLVRTLELRLMAQADIVVVCSRALQALKSRHHPDVRYLPHGVRFSHLNRAVTDTLQCPAELVGAMRGAVIGYLGSIGAHLDMALIRAAALRMPEALFVMAGPVEPDAGDLPDVPNLLYTGHVAYEHVPRFLARFDVALLPWSASERIRYAHPTKLREYLAAGCLVVSTPHPEVSGVSPYIVIADGAGPFTAAIREQLQRRPAVARETVASPMRAHDWAERAARLRAILASVPTAAPARLAP
ncbi:MAG: glycosyltransferase [Aquisalimonadaceae bacterium]